MKWPFSEDNEAAIVQVVPKCLLPLYYPLQLYTSHMTQPTNDRNLGSLLPYYPVTLSTCCNVAFDGRAMLDC